MYALLLIVLSSLLDPSFWHGVFANTPARVIAAAAVVSLIVQSVKFYAPNLISGKVAMTLNLAASLSAVFVGMDPAHFWTVATLQQVAVVFAAAAGIHSTARSFFRNPDPSAPPASGAQSSDPQLVRPLTPYPVDSSNSSKQRRTPEFFVNSSSAPVSRTSRISRVSTVSSVLACFLLLGMLDGCAKQTAATPPAALAPGAIDQFDMTANQTLQTIHAFLATVSTDIRSGKLTLTQAQLIIVDNANRSVNVADAAEKAYHAGGGGDQSVLSAALAAAQSAFAGVQTSMASGVTK